MNVSKTILFLLFVPLLTIRAEDSHTAVMQYLLSEKNQQAEPKSAQINDKSAIKSLLIHPEQRREVLGKSQYLRPDLPELYISSDSHFMIHYTTSGYNAVATTSTNSDGVPDYVFEAAEIAEYAYHLLVDTLGFDPPPQDDVDSPETDIYIQNFAGSAYAYTYPEDYVLSTSRPNDYTAYMEIDNDYMEAAYSTKGLDGLRVTIAHEYFHVVQLGYNWFLNNDLPGSENGDTYFLEWSSTWFEERAYPKINDYLQYLDDFFNSPTKSLWDYDSYSYAMGPFISFLEKQYDDDLLPKTWEKIKSQYAFQSLQDVVKEYGGDLITQYNSYVTACYYTGDRYDENYSISPDAAQFPTLSMTPYTYQDPFSINTDIQPFAALPINISFESNQYLNLSVNTNLLIGSYIIDENGTGDFQRKFDSEKDVYLGETRSGDQLILIFSNPSIGNSRNLDLTLTIAETVPMKILKLYANPYTWKNQEDLHIEFQLGNFINRLDFQIFNVNGQQVYKKSLDASQIEPGIFDLLIEADELRGRNLSSGVYFLQIMADDERLIRKFTIIN